MPTLNIYIGPWKFNFSSVLNSNIYEPPLDSLGQKPVYICDLRNIEKQAEANHEDGLGFFVTIGTLPTDQYEYLGNYLSDPISVEKWRGLFGYTTEAVNIGGALAELLTLRADFDGIDGPKPLSPYRASNGLWVLGAPISAVSQFNRQLTKDGGTLLQQEDFNNFVEMKRREYRQLRAECLENGSNLYLKVLGGWGVLYGFPKPQEIFIPNDLPQEEPLLPDTSLTEAFNGSDSTTWGSNWNAYSGNPEAGKRVSNYGRITPSGSVSCYRVWTTPFSSDNWYSQYDFIYLQQDQTNGSLNGGCGLRNRCNWNGSTIGTYYEGILYIINNDSLGHIVCSTYIIKVVSGTPTTLYDYGGFLIGNPRNFSQTLKFNCNGSALNLTIDGSNYGSVTDSAITGNYYFSISAIDNGATAYRIDNIFADDGITANTNTQVKIDAMLLKTYYKRPAPAI